MASQWFFFSPRLWVGQSWSPPLSSCENEGNPFTNGNHWQSNKEHYRVLNHHIFFGVFPQILPTHTNMSNWISDHVNMVHFQIFFSRVPCCQQPSLKSAELLGHYTSTQILAARSHFLPCPKTPHLTGEMVKLWSGGDHGVQKFCHDPAKKHAKHIKTQGKIHHECR